MIVQRCFHDCSCGSSSVAMILVAKATCLHLLAVGERHTSCTRAEETQMCTLFKCNVGFDVVVVLLVS